jgi:hypothetical protein
MIIDQQELLATRDRLAELRELQQKILSDTKLNPRQRSTELAGVRSLMQEIDRDLRSYHLTQLQERLRQLQVRAANTTPAEVPELVSQLVAAMQELTQAMQPAA